MTTPLGNPRPHTTELERLVLERLGFWKDPFSYPAAQVAERLGRSLPKTLAALQRLRERGLVVYYRRTTHESSRPLADHQGGEKELGAVTRHEIANVLGRLPSDEDALGRAIYLAYQFAIDAPEGHIREAWLELEAAAELEARAGGGRGEGK